VCDKPANYAGTELRGKQECNLTGQGKIWAHADKHRCARMNAVCLTTATACSCLLHLWKLLLPLYGAHGREGEGNLWWSRWCTRGPEVIRRSMGHMGKQCSTKHGLQDCKLLMNTHSTVLHIATQSVYNMYSSYSRRLPVDSPAIVPSMVHCWTRESEQVMGPVPLA